MLKAIHLTVILGCGMTIGIDTSTLVLWRMGEIPSNLGFFNLLMAPVIGFCLCWLCSNPPPEFPLLDLGLEDEVYEAEEPEVPVDERIRPA